MAGQDGIWVRVPLPQVEYEPRSRGGPMDEMDFLCGVVLPILPWKTTILAPPFLGNMFGSLFPFASKTQIQRKNKLL